MTGFDRRGGLPRRRRFGVLAAGGAIGALLFVPYLAASSPADPSALALAGFVFGASALSIGAAWLGLRWADGAGLPMALLLAFEIGARPAVDRRALAVAAGSGLGFGLLAFGALRLAALPTGDASLVARLASAGFAAVTLELVLHLGIMSGVVRATRSRWLGIGIAAVAYVAFHLSSLGGQPIGVVALSAGANGLAGVLFGWLYARFGFEYLVLAHGIAHLVAVGFA